MKIAPEQFKPGQRVDAGMGNRGETLGAFELEMLVAESGVNATGSSTA